MKPFKGTFVGQLFHRILRQSVKLLLLLLLLGSGSLGAQTHSHQSPLYISYEKRVLLTYLLAGAGESEEVQLQLANRIEKTLNRMLKAPPQVRSVKSFAEFIQDYKGPWPNSYSVESDLSLLESQPLRGLVTYKAVDRFGAENHKLQKQIEGFLINQNRRLIERTAISGAPMALLLPVAEAILSTDTREIKQRLIVQAFKRVTSLSQQQFAQLEKVGEQIVSSGKLTQLKPSLKLFLETVLTKYFIRLDLKSKKQIISRFLGENLTSDPMRRFELMLMSSGPQLQKLLQVIAGNSDVSEDLLKVLKKLESKVTPIPAQIVKKLFESERERYKWIKYNPEPLGTGTMAQVHRGSIQTENGPTEVVIRFLKPEIEQRVTEDSRILGEIAAEMDSSQKFRDAGLPRLKPIVQDTTKNVMDELDLTATIERQKKGAEVYTQTFFIQAGEYKNYLKVHVPKVFEGGVGSKLMVQELVVGQKSEIEMQTYKETIPNLGKAIGEQIAKMWAEEAFFKSGFFHSDLHQGNYLVFVQDEAIHVSILDFGMGGILSKEKQQNLVLAGIGLKLERPEVIAKALWGISLPQINQLSEADLIVKIRQKLERIRRGIEKPMELSDLMAWSMDEGLRFTYEIVSMNRGMMIMDQALKEAGGRYTVTDLAEFMVPQWGRGMIADFYRKGILTNKDLLRLGSSSLVPARPNRSGSFQRPLGRVLRCEKVRVL